MDELKKARAVRQRILTKSCNQTDSIIKERSLTTVIDHRVHLIKTFQLVEDAAVDYSDTDIETADDYYDHEQKLYVDQLVKLNSVMKALSVIQHPATKDESTITAMSEVLNTPILYFNYLLYYYNILL